MAVAVAVAITDGAGATVGVGVGSTDGGADAHALHSNSTGPAESRVTTAFRFTAPRYHGARSKWDGHSF